jgi:hypothetical protein
MAKNSQVRELLHDLRKLEVKKAKNGSLTVKGVILLAAGTWTDSNYGTPLAYSNEILEEYATNWFDNPLWSRHGGGTPRSITDKVGEIANQRYENGKVLGDIILHGKTQTSKDTIELITSGLVNAISVEHGGRERWDPDVSSYVSEELIFYGAAIVNKGACSVCTINNEASRSSAEANDMELKELETKLAEAESKIKELSEASALKDTKLAEHEQTFTDLKAKSAELEAKIPALEDKTEIDDKFTALEGRIETVEKTPLPGHTLAGDDDKELGEVSLNPIVRDTEGITRRMF